MRLRSVLFCATALAAVGQPLAGSPAIRLEAGQPVPGLMLPALDDGRPRSLRSFRGQRLILQIFASW